MKESRIKLRPKKETTLDAAPRLASDAAMLKRGVGILFCALILLLSLVSRADAETIVEVCYLPPGTPPGVDTFSMVEDGKGGTWELLNAKDFHQRVKNKIVYRYNPNLGPASLSRFPEKMRPKECTTRPPAEKKEPPKTAPPAPPAAPPPPAPPAAPPPPKKEDPPTQPRHSGNQGAENGENLPTPEPRVETPEEKDAEAYKEFHDRNLRSSSFLPLCHSLVHDKDHPRPEECPAAGLPWADEDPALPNAEQGGQLPKEEVGGVLPNRPYGERALATTAPCSEIKGGCPEDKVKTGDGKGPVAEKTRAEKAREQLAILAGVLNLQMNEDLNRADGSPNGVLGGQNPNGIDSPTAQMIAAALQLSPLARGYVKAFIKKYREAAARKVIAAYAANELNKDAAQFLAKMTDAVHALHVDGTIGPYKYWAEFTAGLKGEFQAHHILEVKWFGDLVQGDAALAPSVILTKAEHEVMTAKLNAAMLKWEPKTAADLWKVYQKVYSDYPHWLEAIRPYFKL